MKNSPILIPLFFALLISCTSLLIGCNSTLNEAGGDRVISISTSIDGSTRVSKSYFESGDAISVYAGAAGGVDKGFIRNSVNTYDGTLWSGEPELKWVYDRKNYDFLAVYPSRAITDFQATDITLDRDMTKNDLLVATAQDLSYDKVSDVALDFTHVMSKLTVKLTFKSNFTEEPTVERVLVGVKNGARINFLTKEVLAQGATAQMELYRENNLHHVAIVAPQSVEVLTPLIYIYLQGDSRPYIFTTAALVNLEQGQERILNLVVGPDNILMLKSSAILPWSYSDSVNGATNQQQDDLIEQDPWQYADKDVITPEKDNDLALDLENSVLPPQSLFDPVSRTLSMPFTGGEAQMSFSGNFDKDLVMESSDSRLTVAQAPGSKFQNSRLVITATQPSGGQQYTAKLKISHALYPDTKFTDVTVTVASYSMPTVVMGGLEWMAFNGCGRSEELYLLGPGMTVRDTYRLNWKKYSALSMWGNRAKPPTNVLIYPWQTVSAANSVGGTVIGIAAELWADNSASIPCPSGWRLPTIEEIQKIWPANGAATTGAYTISGVNYTSSFEHSGGENITADDGKTTIQTNLLIISNGTGELIFPVTGYRAKNTAAVAEFAGRDFHLWTKTKDAVVGAPIADYNKVRIVGISGGKIYNAKVDRGPQGIAFPEAYNGVRCVRNIK